MKLFFCEIENTETGTTTLKMIEAATHAHACVLAESLEPHTFCASAMTEDHAQELIEEAFLYGTDYEIPEWYQGEVAGRDYLPEPRNVDPVNHFL